MTTETAQDNNGGKPMDERIIPLSDEALTLLRQAATPGAEFAVSGRRRSDGLWDIPLDVDTVARLEAAALPGESYSDTVIRIARGHLGRRPD